MFSLHQSSYKLSKFRKGFWYLTHGSYMFIITSLNFFLGWFIEFNFIIESITNLCSLLVCKGVEPSLGYAVNESPPGLPPFWFQWIWRHGVSYWGAVHRVEGSMGVWCLVRQERCTVVTWAKDVWFSCSITAVSVATTFTNAEVKFSSVLKSRMAWL